MALFSRRKKTDPTPEVAEAPESAAPEAEEAPAAPEVNISVQAFRGVGAQAGPEVALEESDAAAPAPAPVQAAAPAAPASPQPAAERPLPLAPIAPPAQNHTVPGMQDNVLLREALARLDEKPTNEQLLGVLRQALQGHLILRVHGDAQEQLKQGQALSIGILRDGDRSFLLAFSSAEALRRVLVQDSDPKDSSAVAQPVSAVLHQVIAGDFTGLILDNASAPHRAVFPTEILKKAIDEADPKLAVKGILAVPQESGVEGLVADALKTTKMWVAAGTQPTGEVGIAEMKSPDGSRFLQLFSHPLEVVALGRGERPLPFTPEQLGKVLKSQSGLSGVLVDPAGPSAVVRREALTELIALAVE